MLQSVSAKLYAITNKILDLYYASSCLHASIDEYIKSAEAQNLDDAFPSMCTIGTTHNTLFCRIFKPVLKMVDEWEDHCLDCSGGWGSKIKVEPCWTSDYISSGYLNVSTPEMRCTEATLGNIIVRPGDLDVLAANAGLATNFGTGQLASATDIPVVRHGYSYQFPGPGAVAPTDQTNLQREGRIFTVRTAASGLNGIGSYSYYYEDSQGNFLAGPDGTDSAPDANGFGTGGTPVSAANYVVAADLPGLKAIKNTSWSVDSNEIATYTNKYAVLYRSYFTKHGDTRQAFDKMIGQELRKESPSTSYSSRLGVTATGADRSTGGATNYGHDGLAGLATTREYHTYGDGPQTPKAVQPPMNLSIPLLFEHNLVKEKAVTVCCIPDACLAYQFETEPLERIFYPAAGSVFIRETVNLYNEANADAGTVDEPSLHTTRHIPYLIPGSVLDTNCCDNRINGSLTLQHYYMEEIVHLSILGKVYFYPIRRILERSQLLSSDTESIDNALNSKFTVEWSFIMDMALASEDEKNNPDIATQWYKPGFQHLNPVHEYHVHKRNKADPTDAVPNYVHEKIMTKYSLQPHQTPIINTLSVLHHGTEYYHEMDRDFYDFKYLFHNGFNNFTYDVEHDGLRPLFVSYSAKPGDHQIWGAIANSSNRKVGYDLKLNPLPEEANYGIRDGITVAGLESELAQSRNKRTKITSVSCTGNFLSISGGTLTPKYA